MMKRSIVVLSTAVALTGMAAQAMAGEGDEDNRPATPNFHGIAIHTPHPHPYHTFLGIVIRPTPHATLPGFHGTVIRTPEPERTPPIFHGTVIHPHPEGTPFRQGILINPRPHPED